MKLNFLKQKKNGFSDSDFISSYPNKFCIKVITKAEGYTLTLTVLSKKNYKELMEENVLQKNISYIRISAYKLYLKIFIISNY